ncbi:MAG TPA: site-2 protease family protein [Candidatus Paceibacterota bacterium]
MLIVIFIITLGVLIVGHEFGHFIVAKLFKLRVDEFGFGFPPKIASKKVGETEYSFNLLPFGGFVKIYGEHQEENGENNENKKISFYHQNAPRRIAVISAGVIMNFIIAWFAFSLVFAIGIPQAVYIESVVEGSPAALAGLKEGDIISEFKTIDEFKGFINQNLEKKVIVNEKEIIPRENPPEGEGAIGVSLREGGIEKQGAFQSLYSGFTTSVDMVGRIFSAFGGMIKDALQGNGETLASVSGPVGIYNFFSVSQSLGFIYLIQFIGIISINLAVFNLLPVPALDGGRLLFIGIEKIIGRRLNYKYEGVANALGFVFLILLAVIVTISDISKLI